MVALFGGIGKASSTFTDSSGPSASRPTHRPRPPSSPSTEPLHFLSLPLWKRRPQNTPSRDVDVAADYPSFVLPSHSYLLDKDLPPTPVDDATEPSFTSMDLAELGVRRERVSSVSQTSSGLPRQSTSALAQAILDVGLSHALPQKTSSSSSAVNTISFTVPSPVTDDSLPTTPNMRKSKSTQGLRKSSPQASMGSSIHDRRIRGLSFGAPPFLQSFSIESKGKEKAKDDRNDLQTRSEKPLSRKTSFWSRKRFDAPRSLSPTSNELPLPSLPSVQPGSPFDIQHLVASSEKSPDARSSHFRGLSRSHSAREGRHDAGRTATNAMVDSHKRPSTAGATIGPLKSSRSFIHTSTNRPQTSSTLNSGLPAVSPEDTLPISRRQRAITTPPLLHRLSLNVFQSSPQEKLHINTSDISQVSTPTTYKDIPKLNDNESPEDFLRRLQISITKKEIPEILASSADPVHSKALRAYIEMFDFTDIALDIALRKLLMEVGLPNETQQIDRVIEAFACHYVHCNPSLFTSDDHPYILAFSLIMLHTDAFNKSNKRKMSKADYVKNTRLPGIAQEVLEYFYDNIVFTPFIYIEEPLEGVRSASHKRLSISTNSTPVSAVPSGNSLLPRANKVDPYYLIGNNLLDSLRVPTDVWINADNLYNTHLRTASVRDILEPRNIFGTKKIRIELPRSNGNGAAAYDLPSKADSSKRQTFTMKVAKIGLLQRKDDLLEGGKRALNRKWRTWTVILAGFQLLFFRDTTMAASVLSTKLCSSLDEDILSDDVFHPDEYVSVKDSIAVFDRSYHKHPNTVRFVLSSGRQMLLQASEENDIDEWLSRINYASTFKSTGVRLRSPTMPTLDVELTGVAAATSHLHDIQRTRCIAPAHSSISTLPLTGDPITEKLSEVSGSSSVLDFSPLYTDMDGSIPTAPEIDGADHLKATFDIVKAELATDSIASFKEATNGRSFLSHNDFSIRSRVIKNKIGELEDKMSSTRRRLEETMQQARNISILTPFQKSTRDRLSGTMQMKSSDIKRISLELCKYSCYHGILSQELSVELQEWDRTKELALRAARETLYKQTRDNPSHTTYCVHTDDDLCSGSTTLQSHFPAKSESSTCGSFHSALEFGPEWPTSHELSGNFLSMPQFMDSPRPSTSESASSFPAYNTEDTLRGLSPSVDNLSVAPSPACTENCEQAESWDETRYAQRVSLIRVPSGMSLPMRGKEC